MAPANINITKKQIFLMKELHRLYMKKKIDSQSVCVSFVGIRLFSIRLQHYFRRKMFANKSTARN